MTSHRGTGGGKPAITSGIRLNLTPTIAVLCHLPLLNHLELRHRPRHRLGDERIASCSPTMRPVTDQPCPIVRTLSQCTEDLVKQPKVAAIRRYLSIEPSS